MYSSRGDLTTTSRPPVFGQACGYKWHNLSLGNASNVNLTTETTEELIDFLDHVGALIKTLISVFSFFSIFLVWWYAELERRLLIIRHHMCAEVGLMFSPLARGFFCEVFINILHVPPRSLPWINLSPEFQLCNFLRLYQVMKMMREHHPMRYNRMTEILRALTEIKMSTSFLLKSYFLSNPLLVLVGLYLFNVFVIGYLVFSMERSYGTCTMYIDVVWMMSVTITNLGFGDFTPSFWLSRVIVSTLSLFGIFQTALIVGVLSDALVIPPDEKRILASLEKQRLEKIRRNTAASLIQWAWRVYVFDQSQQMDCYDRAINNEVTFRNLKRAVGKKYKNLKDGNIVMIKYADALWQWRQVKTQTETVDQAIDREFQVDDTAVATREITSKLDQLEKMVKRAPITQRNIMRQPTVQSIVSTTTDKGGPGSRKPSVSIPSKWRKAKIVGKLTTMTSKVASQPSKVTQAVTKQVSKMASRRTSLAVLLDKSPKANPASRVASRVTSRVASRRGSPPPRGSPGKQRKALGNLLEVNDTPSSGSSPHSLKSMKDIGPPSINLVRPSKDHFEPDYEKGFFLPVTNKDGNNLTPKPSLSPKLGKKEMPEDSPKRIHFKMPQLTDVNEEDESHSEFDDIEQPRYTHLFYSPPLSPLLSRCERSSSNSSSFVNTDQFEQLKKQMDELQMLQAQQIQVQQSFNTSILIELKNLSASLQRISNENN